MNKFNNINIYEKKWNLKKAEILELSEKEMLTLTDYLFDVFKKNLESGAFSKAKSISMLCKDVVDVLIDRQLYQKQEFADHILDIVCFVYDQMYMYKDKVKVLKILIEFGALGKINKIRALENILLPEPELQKLICDDVKRYEFMLQQLVSG